MDAAVILIVDDVPENLRLLSAILKAAGHRVRLVPSGEVALESVRQTPPDLILLDVILPNKNGFQVCRQLKTNNETKEIKVIIVSSKDQPSDKFWGMKQGADDYITKPYSENDLIAAIRKNI